jgi:hypothetical protein
MLRRGARGVDRVCGSDAGDGWVRVGASCYTAHEIPNLGKGAFQCVTPFLVAS